jgi:hypothetical protein
MISPAAIVRKIRGNFNSPRDVLLFLRMSLLVIALPSLLRFLSIPRLMKLLTPRRNTALHDPAGNVGDKITKYTDYLLSRNFWMFRSTCLRRSLVLYHFLRREGLDVRICFGVCYKGALRQEGSGKELEGHAWLLHKGEVFLERNAAMVRDYTITYCFPAVNDHASDDNLALSGEKR